MTSAEVTQITRIPMFALCNVPESSRQGGGKKMVNSTSIEQHPDIMELRARYERAAETPQARVLEGFTFLAGVYAAVSPWVISFNNRTPIAVNDLIIGVALAVLALGLTTAYSRTHNLAWVTPVLGAWLIITPWVILDGPAPTGMVISNVIAGGVALLFGIGMTALEAMGVRRTATSVAQGARPSGPATARGIQR
jgi:hypothetical protein